jgi:predicted flap endonuclease-1-like 5' DNA nuclease
MVWARAAPFHGHLIHEGHLMLTMIQTNALAFGVVLVLGLIVAWLIWGRKKPVRERHRSADVLDEGAGPARRNQALIDAPSAAARVAAPLGGSGVNLGGFGDVAALAAAAEVAAAHEADVVEVVTAPVIEGPVVAGDDLTRLKGVGPKLSARLKELGVVSFAQIAGWSAADLAGIDAQLGTFAGRPARDGWVEQAGFLASGDVAGYEAKFGKL